MKKIKVAMYLNHPEGGENACTVYRNYTPMKYQKNVEVRYAHKVESQIDYDPIKKHVLAVNLDASPIEWADVVVFCRHYDQVALMGCLAEVAEKMGKAVIYETDDLFHRVKLNLGKHNVGQENDKGIGDQQRFLDYILKHCDRVNVSTANLGMFYHKLFNRPVDVLPNCYDPAQWRWLYLYRKLRMFWRRHIKRDKKIRIGWQGGNNHFLNNFNLIVEPLNRLKKKYGNRFEFVIMSGMHPNLSIWEGTEDRRKFLDFKFEWIKGVNVKKFPLALAKMDLDINLVVVEDNEFSRAKSNIKWLEAAILGVPSIASDCEPYKKTNAVLVDNTEAGWYYALESLLLDKKKRDIIGLEARKMAKGFNIRRHAWKWEKSYREALASVLKKKVGGTPEQLTTN